MFSLESRQKDNHTELHLFGRDRDGNKYSKIINGFRPYFYVNEDVVMPDDGRITGVETGHKSIDGVRVKKVFVKKSMDVSEVRERFNTHYEADIPFTNRYLIDETKEVEQVPLKVLYFDIETNYNNVFPDMENPNQEITCISMVDNFDNKPIALLLRSPHMVKAPTEKENVIIYDTEEALLEGFLMHFTRIDPDIITGWNITGFDFPYMIARMAQLHVRYSVMSPMNFVKYDDKYNEVTIKGRVVLDMLEGYMFFRKISNQGRAESYALEFVARDILGKGKTVYDNTLGNLWLTDPDKLVEYNIKDSVLVKELNDKLGIIEFFDSLRIKANCLFKNVYHASVLVDGLLLSRCHNKIVLPSKHFVEGEKYSGAHVFPPVPGLYNYIIALDIKGMYPNIIKSFNMGYETFNPEGQIQITEGIGFDIGAGIISKTVRDLEKERNRYKKLLKNSKTDDEHTEYHYKQYAIKVIMNSIYGYLGFPKSRLYKKEVANAITTMGRRVLIHTSEFLKNLGYKVVYGDTDSVYVISKTDSLFKRLQEGSKLVKLINSEYDKFSKEHGAEECTLEMEFEKTFKKILFVGKRDDSGEGAKKKYAYIIEWEANDDTNVGKLKYTGFETVRSDTPRIAREVQKDILKMIMDDIPKQDIVDYLRKIDTDIREGRIPEDEYCVPTGITNDIESYGIMVTKDNKTYKKGTPPVIAGARYANKFLGGRFAKGSKPKWIKIKSVPHGYPVTEYLAFDDTIPKGFVPDFDYITNRIFIMKLEAIFRSAGLGEFPTLNIETKSFF